MRPQLRAVARGVRPWVRAVRRVRGEQPLTLVGWHRIDERTSDGLSTSERGFEHHLDLLEERGARVLPLTEAVERLALGSLPPRAVALTFDDGYASVVETAWPLLRKRDLPATLFVCTDYLTGARRFDWDTAEPPAERHRLATADQLVEAHGEGLHLGSHTRTHPWLPALPLSLHRAFVPEDPADLDLLLDGAYGFLRPVDAMRRPREAS